MELYVDRKTYKWGWSKQLKENDLEFKPRINLENYLLKHISIGITNACNLNCSYCYKSKEKEKPYFLSFEKIVEFINFLEIEYPDKLKTVQLIGGEPLVHPEINNIITYLLKKKYQVRISTNLSVKLKPNLQKILDNANIELRVSLDSSIPLEHDFFRGKGSFDKTINNIKKLQKNKCRISIKSVITKKNISNLENMLIFLDQLNIKYFSYSTLYNLGKSDDSFYSENYISDFLVIKEIVKIFNKKSELIKLLKPTLLAHTLQTLFIKSPYYFSKFYLYINYDGNIYPQDQLVNEDFKIGTICEINKKSLNNLVSTLKKLKKEKEIERKECIKCTFYPFCLKGNYGELYKIDSTLNKSFNYCTTYKKTIKYLMFNHKISKDILNTIFNY